MAIIPTDRKEKSDITDSAPLDKGGKKKNQGQTEVKLNKAGDVLVNKPELDPLKEEKSHTVAMLFGRMNPPTKGHEENIEGLKKLAKEHNADHVVIASHSHDGEKNPLSPEQKLKHLKRAFPDTNIKTSSKAQPTLLHHASELHKQGYKHLIVAGGGDRADEYHKLLNKYNGVEGRHGHYKFDSITVKSTGERKEGVSGSDMRKHVKSGNFDKFREGLPSKIRENEGHAKELFHDVKGGLKEYYERVGRLIERFVHGKVNEELAHSRDWGTSTLVKQLKKVTPGETTPTGRDIGAEGVVSEESLDEVSQEVLAKAWHKRYQQSRTAERGSPEFNKAIKSMQRINKVSSERIAKKLASMSHDEYSKGLLAAADSERKRNPNYTHEEVELGEGIKSILHKMAAKHYSRKADDAYDMDDEEGFKKAVDKSEYHRVKAGGKPTRINTNPDAKFLTKEEALDEAFLHDPDTYLRMATQAREQGKILRAALLTRIAAAVRRHDTATAMTLRRSLPQTQE